MKKRYLFLLPLLVLTLITFGRTDDNKKQKGEVITKTVSVGNGDRVRINYGRIDPEDMLRLVVTPACEDDDGTITGEVVDADEMGWVGGSEDGPEKKITFMTRPSEYKSGTHIGKFKGRVFCETEGGKGEAGDGETIATDAPEEEPWRIDALATVTEKRKDCPIITDKECNEEGKVLVSASTLINDPQCQINLVNEDGKVIGSGNKFAFGEVSDDETKTITAKTCCGEKEIEIQKDGCEGDNGGGEGCCNLTLKANPDPVSPGEKVTVTADFEFKDEKLCGDEEVEDVCQAKFEASGVDVKKPESVIRSLNNAGKAMASFTPKGAGTLLVSVKPVGKECPCNQETIKIGVGNKPKDCCELKANVDPERVCIGNTLTAKAKLESLDRNRCSNVSCSECRVKFTLIGVETNRKLSRVVPTNEDCSAKVEYEPTTNGPADELAIGSATLGATQISGCGCGFLFKEKKVKVLGDKLTGKLFFPVDGSKLEVRRLFDVQTIQNILNFEVNQAKQLIKEEVVEKSDDYTNTNKVPAEVVEFFLDQAIDKLSNKFSEEISDKVDLLAGKIQKRINNLKTSVEIFGTYKSKCSAEGPLWVGQNSSIEGNEEFSSCVHIML